VGLVGVDGGETTSNVEVVRLARVAREGNEGDGVAVGVGEGVVENACTTLDEGKTAEAARTLE
jgi:hypothetical protein